MGEILSLKDEIKSYKINNNVQKLPIKKREDLILLKGRIKYLESEYGFLKDDIINKKIIIEKVLKNNNKLVEHQSYHVPIQYI